MKASDFDSRFEDGESIIDELDISSARKPNLGQRKVNVDFPVWMIESLDRTARQDGRDASVGYQDMAGGEAGARSRCDQGLMPQLHRETALESEWF